jgi:hypothetical protein
MGILKLLQIVIALDVPWREKVDRRRAVASYYRRDEFEYGRDHVVGKGFETEIFCVPPSAFSTFYNGCISMDVDFWPHMSCWGKLKGLKTRREIRRDRF